VIERVVRPVEIIKTNMELDQFLKKYPEKLIAVIFMEDWQDTKKTIHDNILDHISNETLEATLFCQILADICPELCAQYSVNAVPTIIMFRREAEIDRILGARMRTLVEKITFHAANKAPGAYPDPKKVAEAEYQKTQDGDLRIVDLVKRSKVMLFMKGSPAEPKCGFSRAITAILNETGVPYDTFDILTDEEVRQRLKELMNWQTYPQLYVNNELIGGLDIVKELKESGDLISTLNGS